MKKLAYLLIALPLIFAFGKSKKPETSKYLTKNYVKVPAGKVLINNQIDSCEAFFISRTEITNINWKEFLYYLKQNNRIDEFEANQLDTTVWRDRLAYNEPYVNYYFQHEAYKEYPVVGVTLAQANAYANWLSEIYAMNEKVKEDGVKITFSVPSKKQWIRAARGYSSYKYPNGNTLISENGLYSYNFKRLSAGNIYYDKESDSYRVKESSDREILITAPSESYPTNEFGIYNMSGNVAELVADDTVAMGGSWNDTGYDVRVESEQSATQPKSTIGFRVVAKIEKEAS